MTAQTVTTAVARREAGPVTIMWNRKKHFAAVLPQHVDVEAFLGTAAGALYANPKLMEAAESDPDSLIIAMMRCAALGHQPGTDEFYLTPRKVKGKPSIVGIEGYRGIVERMYRSGAVKSVIVREVCAKDKFRYVDGLDDRPLHATGGGDPLSETSTGADFFGELGVRNRGPMVGVYAYAILTTGAVSRVVLLSRDDVMAARERSDAKDSDYSPWNALDGGKDHPEFTGRSMWWKTAARRLEPWVPTSAEYRREQLRASAEAAAIASNISNGGSIPPDDMPGDIRDAEIVDDPQAPDGASSETPNQEPLPAPTQAGVENLLAKIQLGAPADVRAFWKWQLGRNTPGRLTRGETEQVHELLAGALDQAGGDPEEARSLIWAGYNTQTAAVAGDE